MNFITIGYIGQYDRLKTTQCKYCDAVGLPWMSTRPWDCQSLSAT